MDSLILIIISTLIFLPYIIYQYKKKDNKECDNDNNITMQLHQVEAGPTRSIFNLNKKIDLLSLVDVNVQGISINPELQYFIVKNKCMSIKGISEGDIIGVRMLKDKHNWTPKKGCILLIYLNDDHFKGYKIREQGDPTADGNAFNTYHYEGGKRNQSSKPHSIASIKGIVEEVHQRHYSIC